MYQEKVEFNHFGVSKEVKRIREEDNNRRRILNTICNRCKNIPYCHGGIPGCGGFTPRDNFKK